MQKPQQRIAKQIRVVAIVTEPRTVVSGIKAHLPKETQTKDAVT
jgi:hypothetical protein